MNRTGNYFTQIVVPTLAVIFALAGILDFFQPNLFGFDDYLTTGPLSFLVFLIVSLVFGVIGVWKGNKIGRVVGWLTIGIVIVLSVIVLSFFFFIAWTFRNYNPVGIPVPPYNPTGDTAGYIYDGPANH